MSANQTQQNPGLLGAPPPLETPPIGYAAAGQRDRRRTRGGRGRGRGRGNAPAAAGAGQPTLPPPNGAPIPQRLATRSTPEKNDPLWSTGLAGLSVKPKAGTLFICPGAEALPTLSAVLQSSYVAASPGYGRRVSSSMLAYYCAALTWHRMLWLHQQNGFTLRREEERYIEQIAKRAYEPPALLAQYLAGFGNTRVPNGRDVRFCLRDRPAHVRAGNVRGWWGAVSATTQPLYQNYPCLAVYAARILASMEDDTSPWWMLPEAMRPNPEALPNGLRPSEAMLGYGPRDRMSPERLEFLQVAKILPGDAFPSLNYDLSLSLDLLDAVQVELRNVDKLKLSPMPMLLLGSQAQLAQVFVLSELDGVGEHVLECNFPLPDELAFPASAFIYRRVHAVAALTGEEGDVPWCIYKHAEGAATATAWYPLAAVGNALRTEEPPFLANTLYHTTNFIVKSMLEALEVSLRGG